MKIHPFIMFLKRSLWTLAAQSILYVAFKVLIPARGKAWEAGANPALPPQL